MDVLPWCEALTWVDPDGAEYVLTADDDHSLLEGVDGRGMPPIRTNVQTVPLQPGTRTRSVTHDARTVALPLAFYDTSLDEVRAILRGRMRTFDPTRGDSVLRVLTADGVERELTCHYIGGFEIEESPPARGVSPDQAHQAGVLVVHADDPYWYGTTPYTNSWTVESAPGSFFPIPNPTTGSFITLVASEVFAVVTIDTDADVESWPVWTITGPGTNPVLTNLLTGGSLDLSGNGGLTLADGEVVTIDTRPYVKTVELDDGTNLYPYLTDAGSDFWPLLPGSQQVQVEMGGADLDSLLAVSVDLRYLTV